MLQAYAAAKARDYLDKPAVHETMVKVRFEDAFSNQEGIHLVFGDRTEAQTYEKRCRFITPNFSFRVLNLRRHSFGPLVIEKSANF